jgi:hypothetical protein
MTTATIPSRTSAQQYIVTLHDDGSTSCTCKAGQFGKGCWHQAALKAEAARRERYELVSIRSGRRYGVYGTLAEATAARDEIGRNGGWACCYRLA